jgi:hypothetical protein
MMCFPTLYIEKKCTACIFACYGQSVYFLKIKKITKEIETYNFLQ